MDKGIVQCKRKLQYVMYKENINNIKEIQYNYNERTMYI